MEKQKQEQLKPGGREIDNRIKQMRYLKALTLRELAEKSGVTHQEISRYEHGHRKVSVQFLARMAKGLNCPFTDLLPETLVEQLPVDQQELLALYRDLPKGNRSAMLEMVRVMAGICKTKGHPDGCHHIEAKKT